MEIYVFIPTKTHDIKKSVLESENFALVLLS